MLEYRRHRLRKAAKSIFQGMSAPMAQPVKLAQQALSTKSVKNQYIPKKKLLRTFSSASSHKLYP